MTSKIPAGLSLRGGTDHINSSDQTSTLPGWGVAETQGEGPRVHGGGSPSPCRTGEAPCCKEAGANPKAATEPSCSSLLPPQVPPSRHCGREPGVFEEVMVTCSSSLPLPELTSLLPCGSRDLHTLHHRSSWAPSVWRADFSWPCRWYWSVVGTGRRGLESWPQKEYRDQLARVHRKGRNGKVTKMCAPSCLRV